ncbi:MAG: DUF3857 and transglutaminase domain-containing protein [Bacteroidota bacterium]
MLKLLPSLLFCIFTSINILAQTDLSVGNIPEDLAKDAMAVVRSEKTYVDVESSALLKVKHYKAVTIFSEKSREDVLVLYYDDFKKVNKIKASIYNAFGEEVRTLKKNEIKDVAAVDGFSIYSDNRIKYVDVDYNEYPYTIQFEYEYETRKFKYYPSWHIMDYGVAIQSSEFSLSFPSEYEVQYRAYNIDIEPQKSTDKGKTILDWKIENKNAVRYESYAPIRSSLLPYVALSPSQFQLGKYKGDMTSWENYGKFMYDLNKGRDVLSDQMKTTVQTIIKEATNDREKVDLIYQYLKDNMRYVSVQLGVGGWQTFDAMYVEENKYGDCKALTNFTKAMLKEAGIKSHVALINSGNRVAAADPNFTRPVFNHVILNVPDEDLWLECTSNSYPSGYLGTDNFNKNVLLITEDGGKFTSTPKWSYQDNITESKTTITVALDGTAQIENVTKHKGARHELLRALENQYGQEKIEKYFLENFDLSVSTLNRLEIESDDDSPNASISYDVSLSKFGSKAGKRFFFPLNGIHKFKRKLAKSSDRVNPIVIENAYIEENEITIMIPEFFELESYPKESVSINSEFGSYDLEVFEQDGNLSIKRKLEVKPIQVPAEKYNDLRAFYKQIQKADNSKIVAKDIRT